MGIVRQSVWILVLHKECVVTVAAEGAPNGLAVKTEQNLIGSCFTQLLQGPEASVTAFSSVLSPHHPPVSWKQSLCSEERPKALLFLSLPAPAIRRQN